MVWLFHFPSDTESTWEAAPMSEKSNHGLRSLGQDLERDSHCLLLLQQEDPALQDPLPQGAGMSPESTRCHAGSAPLPPCSCCLCAVYS